MPAISLTKFVDFLVADGTTRLRRVQETKQQQDEDYSPATDYYKGSREGIVEFHRDNLRPAFLDGVAARAHAKKTLHYSTIVKGYKAFLRKKQITSFDARKGEWSHGNLTVTINPELGLKIDGAPHLVKLYFKKTVLSQRRVEVVLRLMERSLASSRVRVGILDARMGKLYTPRELPPELDAFLAGEAAAFVEMWNLI